MVDNGRRLAEWATVFPRPFALDLHHTHSLNSDISLYIDQQYPSEINVNDQIGWSLWCQNKRFFLKKWIFSRNLCFFYTKMCQNLPIEVKIDQFIGQHYFYWSLTGVYDAVERGRWCQNKRFFFKKWFFSRN